MSGILRYLLETGLCIALFYAGFWLFLRKETCFLLNRVYLVASLVLSFLIPAFKIASPFETVVVPSGSALEAASLPPLPARAIGLTEVLFWAYVAGAAFFLVRFAAHLFKLYRVIRMNGHRALGGLKVVSIDKEFAPFSFLGFVFLNGPGSGPLELKHVLAHERAHVRQRHSLDILLVEGATVLQWFNPIVRPYKRSIQETHEFLADGEVIAQGFDAARYRLTLLEQQVGARLLEFSHEFRQSQIKRRITMMSHARSKGAAGLKALVLLPLAMLLVLALAQPRPISAADRSPVSIGQEKSGTAETALSREERIAQVKKNLEVLVKKEADLKQALESVSDPAKREDLQKSLQVFGQLRESYEAYLKDPDHVPPPPPLPPKKAGPGTVSENLAIVKAKEAELRKVLDETTDPAKREDLQKSLQVFGQLRESYEAYLKDPDHVPPPPPLPPPAFKGKADLKMLMEKQADIEAQLAKEKDPAKAKDLEEMLNKVMAKRKDLEAKLKEKEKAVREQLAVEKDPEKIKVLQHDLQVALAKEANPDAQVGYAAEVHGSPKSEDAKKLMDERMKYQQIMADKEQWSKLSDTDKANIKRFLELTARLKDLEASSSAHSKEMLIKLDAAEAAARKELSETQDPEKKAGLEKALKELQLKREELKAMPGAQPGREFTLQDLLQMSKELKAKEADIQAELAKTQDAEKTAKLKEMLSKVRAKQEQAKAMIEKAQKGEEK